MNGLLFDKINFYSLTQNILWTACVVNSVSFHFRWHIRGKYTHKTWLFQSCLVSLQSTGLFVTQPNLMGHFAGRIDWKKPIWRQQVMTSLCTNDMTAVSLIDCILTQWPLIVLKSSWVDSQWAELNGNTPCLCVARPTHVVSSSLKRVIHYWNFIPEGETHITHCIVW